MRLVEYLYADPGGPPTPDSANNWHMAGGREGEHGLTTSSQVADQEPHRHGDPIAPLDGGFYHLPSPYSQLDALYYRHILSGTVDEDSRDHLGRIFTNEELRFMYDRARSPSYEISFGDWKARHYEEISESAGHCVQDPLDEVLKKGVQSNSAYDNRTIGKLKNGKFPGRAEDGKGFCFIWAEGRGICAFRWRGDALRWAQDAPRDIVRFWYGEPISPSGKFRIRVRDRYRKEEAVETFTALLERRAEKGLPLYETGAEDVKRHLMAQDDTSVPTMWQLEARLRASGHLRKGLALAFFCPVYFAGQKIVEALLDKEDEHGEKIIFSLPPITNPARIQVGLDQMRRLGIENPEQHLKKITKGKHEGELGLRTYSSLPGIEGVGSGRTYGYIGQEAVQLGAFMLVPEEWINEGDPYNQSYRFPGEEGYSPYWRIPSFKEFSKMRPKLAADFRSTSKGVVRRRKPRNEAVETFTALLERRAEAVA